VTHLHSDHTAGYSDLILTGWTAGRRTPLEVYGPTGLQSMTEHILQAYRVDIETRTNRDGDQRGNPGGWKVNTHEIKTGVIYQDAKVTVTGASDHGPMERAHASDASGSRDQLLASISLVLAEPSAVREICWRQLDA
jgi:ribonuclease BN (tRNA processing enzyme)